MSGRRSLKHIAKFIDERTRAVSLREVLQRHRWSPQSFSSVVARHSSALSIELSFLWYNTWLLKGVAGIGDKPLVGLRSYLIGRELQATGYGIAGLCEVFDQDSQRTIHEASGLSYRERGPVATAGRKSSGLLTLSRYPLRHTSRRRFENSGSGDDWWTNKGILHTRIDLAIGALDLYTTHMSYGNKRHTPERRSRERLSQVEEICKFISTTHDPANVVILAGDMNINAAPRISDPERHQAAINRFVEVPRWLAQEVENLRIGSREGGGAYRLMCERLSNIRITRGARMALLDLWPFAGGLKGATNYMYMNCKAKCRLIENGRVYCDDDWPDDVVDEGRIDYVFVQEPARDHSICVDFTRMKRRPFPVPALSFADIIRFSPLTKAQRRAVERLLKSDVMRAVPLLQRSGILPPAFAPRTPDEVAAAATANVRRKLKQHESDPYGHLSDHLGLEVTLLVSPR